VASGREASDGEGGEVSEFPSFALTGQTAPSADAIARAASQAADKVDALGDIHASADFRRHLAEVNTIRALTRAYSVR